MNNKLNKNNDQKETHNEIENLSPYFASVGYFMHSLNMFPQFNAISKFL